MGYNPTSPRQKRPDQCPSFVEAQGMDVLQRWIDVHWCEYLARKIVARLYDSIIAKLRPHIHWFRRVWRAQLEDLWEGVERLSFRYSRATLVAISARGERELALAWSKWIVVEERYVAMRIHQNWRYGVPGYAPSPRRGGLALPPPW